MSRLGYERRNKKVFRHYLKTKSDNTQVMLGDSSFHSMIIANESLIVNGILSALRALGITQFTGPPPLHHSSPSLPYCLPFLQFLLLLPFPLFSFISHPFHSHRLRSRPLNTVRDLGSSSSEVGGTAPAEIELNAF